MVPNVANTLKKKNYCFQFKKNTLKKYVEPGYKTTTTIIIT